MSGSHVIGRESQTMVWCMMVLEPLTIRSPDPFSRDHSNLHSIHSTTLTMSVNIVSRITPLQHLCFTPTSGLGHSQTVSSRTYYHDGSSSVLSNNILTNSVDLYIMFVLLPPRYRLALLSVILYRTHWGDLSFTVQSCFLGSSPHP